MQIMLMFCLCVLFESAEPFLAPWVVVSKHSSARIGGTTRETPESEQKFYEFARKGIEQLKYDNLQSAILSFDQAVLSNNSFPLPQRGIALYIAGRYEEAALQLQSDVDRIEEVRFTKAAELRLWISACWNKAGDPHAAFRALDLYNECSLPQETQSHFTNITMLFFGGKQPIDALFSLIADTDEKDAGGVRFHGNFFLGLYHDSIGDADLAEAFLKYPAESVRYPPNDLWYHVPRLLYLERFRKADSARNPRGITQSAGNNEMSMGAAADALL